MNYSLNTKLIQSGSTIQNAIILCHGYGGDGNDISIVANYWKNFLPNTLFSGKHINNLIFFFNNIYNIQCI